MKHMSKMTNEERKANDHIILMMRNSNVMKMTMKETDMKWPLVMWWPMVLILLSG